MIPVTTVTTIFEGFRTIRQGDYSYNSNRKVVCGWKSATKTFHVL